MFSPARETQVFEMSDDKVPYCRTGNPLVCANGRQSVCQFVKIGENSWETNPNAIALGYRKLR
jgi:hypothetical protein